jgi:hypothetical protein
MFSTEERRGVIGCVWCVAGALAIAVFCLGPGPPPASAAPAEPPELIQARENLRVSREARDRVAGELEALKSAAKASPEAVAAYETYLARIQDLVDENELVVSRMEAALAARPTASRAVEVPPREGADPKDSGDDGAADRLTALDRQLNSSLAAFDEMLLKELRLIQASSARRTQGLAEAAAEAGRKAGEAAGTAASESEAGGESGRQAKGGEQDGGRASQTPAKPGEASAGGRDPSGGWGSGGTGSPPGGYTSGADDDIVARQLREAAEKETDPELKAKLWKEYEAYKRGQAKP